MTDSPWKLPQENKIKIDAGLRQLINGIPGEAPITKILPLANIGSIELLEALGSLAFWGADDADQRSDPEVIADKVLKLAKACEPQAYKDEIASVESSMWEASGAAARHALFMLTLDRLAPREWGRSSGLKTTHAMRAYPDDHATDTRGRGRCERSS